MTSLVFLPLALIWGALLSTIYFVGLWVTVRKLPQARSPIFLAIGSFIGRLGIVLGGFSLLLFFAKDYALLHLLACLVTFFWCAIALLNSTKPACKR